MAGPAAGRYGGAVDPPFPLLWRDADRCVIAKPAGLAVHPGPRTPRSLEDDLPALAAALGLRRPPVIAHRLDRDTSGCLALGLNRRGTRLLAQAFADGTVDKVYLALLDGLPARPEGRIDAPLAKISSAADGWRMVVRADGRPAATRWRVVDAARRLVEFRPETGRTHQIRVHAAQLGCPIAGDPVYGRGIGPMRLHASALTLPGAAGPVTVTAPLPDDWPA